MKNMNFISVFRPKNAFVYVTLTCILLAMQACKDDDKVEKEDRMVKIEAELNALATLLASDFPDSLALSDRIKQYITAHPSYFFGSTVTVLDTNEKAVYSPYWYRSGDSLAFKNLADTTYHIDDQEWLRLPIDLGAAIWTKVYFDAGGGEIWMRTRSVPIVVNGKMIAVATTDMESEKP